MKIPAAFVHGIVDYAGLFPPAQLPMPTAAADYASFRSGPHRSLLGRFVVPAPRLAELAAAVSSADHEPWPVSVLATPGSTDELAELRAMAGRYSHLRLDSIETKATGLADFQTLATARGLETWVEVAPGCPELPAIASAAHEAGVGLKLRTGGVTSDAFPAAAEVIRFIRTCDRAKIAFKATAGLHHPLRGNYRLTYEASSASAPMYGFLNVFLTAALIRQGGNDESAMALLLETDARQFSAQTTAVRWRDQIFSEEQLAATRRMLCRSFGSCSFTEPVEGLQELRWL